MNHLSRKLAYRRDIRAYISELRALTRMEITEGSLLPLDQLEPIREEVTARLREPTRMFTIPFEEKSGERFKKFVGTLGKLNPGRMYVFTNRTNSCGPVIIDDIEQFNFDFDYSVNSEGIVSLVAEDLRDRMVLDFSKDENDRSVLRIELFGEKWPSAEY